MATSGYFEKKVGSGYALRLEWSASQDKANNRSTIESKLYWVSLGSSYTISSGSRTGRNEISGSGTDFTATASLSGNQKKLLSTYSRTMSHDSDGNLSVTPKGVFPINVTLSGTYYGTITVSGTAPLDKIPRESSITSSLNFTAPNGFPISISRASSSYTHTVRLYVDGTLIKTSTGVGAGITWGFADSEMTAIFNKLAQRRSCPLQLQLDTYSGSTKVGSTKSYNGTVFAEYASTNVNSPDYNIGDPYKVSVARNNSNFKHKAIFRINGVEIHRSPDYFDYTYDWLPTAAELKKAFDTTKTTSNAPAEIELITYYNGVQVNNGQVQKGTAKVVNSNPTFSAGFVYEDTNASTLALTGDKYSIVQKASIPKVTIPVSARALGKNSADIVRYTASLDGQTISADWSSTNDVIFTFKPVLSGQNMTLAITAIDSRGNTTRATKTVNVVPYSNPTMNATVRRKNGFEAETLVNLKGAISPLTVSGVNKNAVVKAEYRYRENIPTTVYPSTWTNLPVTTSNLSYTATEQTVNLVQNKQYIFQFRITDKVGDTLTERTVNKGKPIFMIDEKLGAIGIGRFPSWAGGLDMAGPLRNAGDIKALNPANEQAEVYLGWKDNQARMRIGGTGSGAISGFQIHGTGDKILMALDNSQNADFYGKVRINGSDISRPVTREAIAMKAGSGWSGYFNPEVLKTREGVVVLQGMMRYGTVNSTAFVLPVSCWPNSDQLLYIPMANGNHVRCDIKAATGEFQVGDVRGGNSFDNSFLNLNGIAFMAAQ